MSKGKALLRIDLQFIKQLLELPKECDNNQRTYILLYGCMNCLCIKREREIEP